MRCSECDAALETSEATRCAKCAREDELYTAFVQDVEVPPMWSGVQGRIARDTRRRRIVVVTALAASLAAALFLATLIRRPNTTAPVAQAPPAQAPLAPAVEASQQYEKAIAALEGELQKAAPHRRAEASVLLSQISDVVDDARRAALAAPNDPIAVSTLMSAYDAKVDLLRDVVDGA